MRHIPHNRPLVVFRIGQLGDTIVSLPAIAELRRQNPGRRLVFVTDHHPAQGSLVSSWDVLGALGLCDEVVKYEVHRSAIGRINAYFRLAGIIRAIAPSEVVNLADRTKRTQEWRDLLFFRYVCGAARYKALPARGNPESYRAATAPVAPEWFRILQVVDSNATLSCPPEIELPESAHAEARYALGKTFSTALVGLSPGSKMPAKRWPAERYLEVGTRILAEYPALNIVILGGEEDRALGDTLQRAWGYRALNLCGKLSVLGSAAVLARCLAYVGNDTGAMHLAGLVGTQSIALFSARDRLGKWTPIGEPHRHHIIRKDVPCAGCMLAVCNKRNLCLTQIESAEVVSACKAMVGPMLRTIEVR